MHKDKQYMNTPSLDVHPSLRLGIRLSLAFALIRPGALTPSGFFGRHSSGSLLYQPLATDTLLALMSMDFSMAHVYAVQSLLDRYGIASLITGDLGSLYHGVDIALHVSLSWTLETLRLTRMRKHVELCVPASEKDRVRKIIGSDPEFVPLPDITEPDFYHPYKRGASRFQFTRMNDGINLHIITDTALPLPLTPPSTSANTVKTALATWCHDTDEDVLGKLRFPTLSSFLNAWLDLASATQATQVAEKIVFLMEAERLIDGNSIIDRAWCSTNIHSEESLLLATQLLEDQATRIGHMA